MAKAKSGAKTIEQKIAALDNRKKKLEISQQIRKLREDQKKLK